MRLPSLAFAPLCATMPAAALDVTELRLTPADTSIYAHIAGVNQDWDHVSDGQGSSLWLSTTAGGVQRRSLVRFDLGAVPAGFTVVSATLSLFESRTRDAHEVSLHRMRAPWGEGASDGGSQGLGDQVEAGDATCRWSAPRTTTSAGAVPRWSPTSSAGWTTRPRTTAGS